MAEVTLATLESDSEGIPTSGSAGTRRFITALGPLKIEWNYFQQATGDNFAESDTFVSRLAHPFGAAVLPLNVDLGDTAFPGSAALDTDETSATFKTVTVHDANNTSALGLVVVVIGF